MRVYKVGEEVKVYNKIWTVDSIKGDFIYLLCPKKEWLTEHIKCEPLPTKRELTLKPTY